MSSELTMEHLGRTGAATPPPSAPKMMSRTAEGFFRSPSRTESTRKVATAAAASWPALPRLARANARSPTSDFRPSTCSSGALPSSWRKTWSDVGAFPSPTLRRGVETLGPERDVSTPARRANRTAEEKLRQYASAQLALKKGSPSSGGYFSDAPGSDFVAVNRNTSNTNSYQVNLHGNPKEWEQSFKENALAVDSLIQNLTSNARLDPVKGQKAREAEQAAKQREEQRRLNAVEERTARKREAAARDPHIKVNLRLENTRKYNMDAMKEMPIPMMQVPFNGASGTEDVSMVDCLKIRQRCKRIDTGNTPSVRALVEDQTRTDRLYGLHPKTGKPKNASSTGILSLPSQDETSTVDVGLMGSEDLVASSKLWATRSAPEAAFFNLPSVEDRSAQAINTKEVHFVGCMLRRLNAMRSTPTEATLANLEQIVNSRHKQRHRDRGREEASLNMAIEDGAEVEGSLESVTEAIKMVRKSVETAKQKKVSIPKSKPKPRPELDAKGHQRAQHAWRLLRSAAAWLMLYHYVKRKRASISLVKAFLSTLGEWSRVKLSMSRLLANLKILQRACRQFLTAKRKRTEIMSKEWQRVEDHHLSIHFKELAQKSIDEITHQEEIARSKGRFVPHKTEHEKQRQNEMHKLMKQNIDWKMYRIPTKERKAILSRYYMSNLKKRTEGMRNLLSTVRNVVKLHHETMGFLRSFGAVDVHIDDVKQMTLQQHQSTGHSHEFWHLTEERVLDLMASAAHQLRHLQPWRDHPAHMDRPGNPMYRPQPTARGAKPGALVALGDTKSRSSNVRRGKSTRVDPTPQHVEDIEEAAPDVDRLWETFTPRLKDLAKEATNRPDSRMSNRPCSRPGLGEQDQVAWRL